MTIGLCRKIAAVADRQAELDKKRKRAKTTFRYMSCEFNMPDRGVSDIRSILKYYDKYNPESIDAKCIEKCLKEKSLSQTRKVALALCRYKEEDKVAYLEGRITSTALRITGKRPIPNIMPSLTDAVIENAAKRLKDDTDIDVTIDIIAGMFHNTTKDYLSSVLMYIEMCKTANRDGADMMAIKNNLYVAKEAVNKVFEQMRRTLSK